MIQIARPQRSPRAFSLIPWFDRKRPFLRPDLPIGKAPRADAVQDAVRHRRSRREASWTASSTALLSHKKGLLCPLTTGRRSYELWLPHSPVAADTSLTAVSNVTI